MRSRVSFALTLAVTLVAGAAHAQQPPSQTATPGPPPDPQVVNACVESQRQASAFVAFLSRRAEAARGSDSPTDMRSAMDDVQVALNHMRSAVRLCAPVEVAGPTADPHAGHNMGATPPAPVPPSTPVSRPGSAVPLPATPTAMDHAAMGHAMPSSQAAPLDPQLVRACVESQREAGAFAERLNRRLDLVRQTNAAAAMRAALEDLPVSVGDVRASLQRCDPLQKAVAAAATAAPMDHSKVAMGGTSPAAKPEVAAAAKPATAPGAKAATAVAPMDHSKMAMGSTSPAAKPAVAAGAKPATPPGATAPAAAAAVDHSKMAMGSTPPAAKPGTSASAKPMSTPGARAPAAAAPIDHSKMAMGGTPPAAKPGTAGGDPAAVKMDVPKLPVLAAQRVADPACPKNVAQPNAPKAAYQLKMYYFCSVADRDQFRKDPAAYLKKRPR